MQECLGFLIQNGGKTMKIWKKPTAGTQLFAANDSVSACTIQILCACTLPNGADSVRVLQGNTVDFDGDGVIEGVNDGFMPCNEIHNPTTDTEFFYYDFAGGWNSSNATVTFDAPVKLAWWREMDKNGNVVDVHITDPANVTNAESNKS